MHRLVNTYHRVHLCPSHALFQIFEDGKLSGYIDGSDLNVTSWMRFIRCARRKQEQNLFAFQYLGKVFYRTFKDILPGEEMLVWYDEKYPQYLGIPAAIFDMGAVIPRGKCSAGSFVQPLHLRIRPFATWTVGDRLQKENVSRALTCHSAHKKKSTSLQKSCQQWIGIHMVDPFTDPVV